METVHVVWLKRDLRLTDHRPFVEAAQRGKVLPLYVFEPDLCLQPEMDQTHFDFIKQSLEELDRQLIKIGLRLQLYTGNVIEVLDSIRDRYVIGGVYSHQEVGGKWTFDRDRAVGRYLKAHGIPWSEYTQNGVVRGLKNRDRWATSWKRTMSSPQASLLQAAEVVAAERPLQWPDSAQLHIRPIGSVDCQVGGESNAHSLLNSFLQNRGANYRTAMSSPLSAETHCSRLSPYIAWGCITIKQISQAVRAKIDEIQIDRASGVKIDQGFVRSLTSYQSRLSWHCHFMQKMDDEPELEFRNLCRAYDGMREDNFRSDYFEQWCQGLTGYPMIDACMRYLHRHRWINFRMRAMLVSFASYHLWLHWRETSIFLARHFLDFEPGIHFPQVQMQSGVTGINTIRIYSPVKQAMDQDPNGDFVRQWIPELEHVPRSFIFEPWKMSVDDQVRYRCRIGLDYPHPVVEHRTAVAYAKDRIYEVRKSDLAVVSAKKVYQKHGSRKHRDPLPKSRKPSASPKQPPLPGMDDI
jgi:deoxyribodipyrimidine photo-lyase